MNCQEVLSLLDALADKELPAKDENTVRSHLNSCPDCTHELQQINALRAELKQTPRYPTPPSLADKIHTDLTLTSSPSPVSNKSRWLLPTITHIAAALAGGVILYGLLLPKNPTQPTTGDIIAAHVQSLQQSNIIQIASSNRHTVGPWFAGKLDYAPPVRDLKAQGYLLLGGRIDNLANKKTAVLVYQRRKHKINLFITPHAQHAQGATTRLLQQKIKGFNIASQSNADFAYWAISDLSEQEIVTFIGLIAGKN